MTIDDSKKAIDSELKELFGEAALATLKAWLETRGLAIVRFTKEKKENG